MMANITKKAIPVTRKEGDSVTTSTREKTNFSQNLLDSFMCCEVNDPVFYKNRIVYSDCFKIIHVLVDDQAMCCIADGN